MAFSGNVLRKTTLELGMLGDDTFQYEPRFLRIGDNDATIIRVTIMGSDINVSDYSFGFEAVTSSDKLINDFDSSRFRKIDGSTFEYKVSNKLHSFIGSTKRAYFVLYKGDERTSTQDFTIYAIPNAEEGATGLQEHYISRVDDIIDNTNKELTDYLNELNTTLKKYEEDRQKVQEMIDLVNANGAVKNEDFNPVKLKASAIVYSKEFDLKGDGTTDDSVELNKMFASASGKLLILESDKVFGIKNEATVRILSNTKMFTCGSSFKKITAGGNNCLQITGSNVEIDTLKYVPFPSADETALRISGNNVKIGTYESISPTPNCGGSSVSKNALMIYNNDTSTVSNISIGKIVLKNWERNVQMRNAQYVNIGDVDIDTFLQGLYYRDTKHSTVSKGHIRGLSTNADGNPGQNGILIESYSDYASSFLSFENIVTESTGEHGYRIGGQFPTSDITYTNCTSINPGNGTHGNGGSEAGKGHGGCGFKALGPTSSTAHHRNIKYLNCIAEDGRANLSSRDVNFAGFQIAKCQHVTVENPIVRSKKGTTNKSFCNGIEVIGSEDVNITNPNISNVTNNGIHFYDASQATGNFGTVMARVNINGGIITGVGANALYYGAKNVQFRRIMVSNLLMDIGSAPYAIYAEKGQDTFLNSCSVSGRVVSNSGTNFSIGTEDFMLTMSGTLFGTAPCSVGSTFQDAYNRSFKTMKSTGWAIL
ncbi:hypothetical protein PSYJYH_000048 [Bacillus phage PSYJ-YH]|nr:hypothetical protein PSYJYH_000048 [Bacillus phage PSYJ-YH]